MKILRLGTLVIVDLVKYIIVSSVDRYGDSINNQSRMHRNHVTVKSKLIEFFHIVNKSGCLSTNCADPALVTNTT